MKDKTKQKTRNWTRQDEEKTQNERNARAFMKLPFISDIEKNVHQTQRFGISKE
jgi:hypothetical protein